MAIVRQEMTLLGQVAPPFLTRLRISTLHGGCASPRGEDARLPRVFLMALSYGLPPLV
jgi:hypothetical protein